MKVVFEELGGRSGLRAEDAVAAGVGHEEPPAHVHDEAARQAQRLPGERDPHSVPRAEVQDLSWKIRYCKIRYFSKKISKL